MKHRILQINISLFALIAGIDVQAYDRIELAGDVLSLTYRRSWSDPRL
jgi:hypothetical protein